MSKNDDSLVSTTELEKSNEHGTTEIKVLGVLGPLPGDADPADDLCSAPATSGLGPPSRHHLPPTHQLAPVHTQRVGQLRVCLQ